MIFPYAITYRIVNSLCLCSSMFICLPIGTAFTIYTRNQCSRCSFAYLTIFIHIKHSCKYFACGSQCAVSPLLQIGNGNAVIGLKRNPITIIRGIGNHTIPIIGFLYIGKDDFINFPRIDYPLGIRTAELRLRSLRIFCRYNRISRVDNRKLVITGFCISFHNRSFIDNILN